MKKLIISCLLILLTVSVAMATWITDFQDNYESVGIDKAVVLALNDDGTTDMIMENGLQLDVNPVDLIKAIYCAGQKGEVIIAAAEHWAVSYQDLVDGYTKAVEECDIKDAFSQAYIKGSGSPGSSPCRKLKCIDTKYVKTSYKCNESVSPVDFETCVKTDEICTEWKYVEIECE